MAVEKHPNAEPGPVADVRHLCPHCGMHPIMQPVCRVCQGAGTLTDEQLKRYLWVQNQQG
jgi:hypothetical protein